MRIAISTGGGDAPGLNAVIRAAVLSATSRGWDVLGICRGYYGLLGEDDIIPLTRETVRGIALMMGPVSAALYALALVFAWRYPITRENHARARAQLAAGRPAVPATDAVPGPLTPLPSPPGL